MRCTLGCESDRYIVVPSGLKARPLPRDQAVDAVAPTGPRASKRYSAPSAAASDMSRTMLDDPEAALAVAAAVVEAHAVARMGHAAQALGAQFAIGPRPQVEQPVFHRRRAGRPGRRARCRPAAAARPSCATCRWPVVAMQCAALDVDPPQRLLGRRTTTGSRRPGRAASSTARRMCCKAVTRTGPCVTKPPPWYSVAGSLQVERRLARLDRGAERLGAVLRPVADVPRRGVVPPGRGVVGHAVDDGVADHRRASGWPPPGAPGRRSSSRWRACGGPSARESSSRCAGSPSRGRSGRSRTAPGSRRRPCSGRSGRRAASASRASIDLVLAVEAGDVVRAGEDDALHAVLARRLVQVVACRRCWPAGSARTALRPRRRPDARPRPRRAAAHAPRRGPAARRRCSSSPAAALPSGAMSLSAQRVAIGLQARAQFAAQAAGGAGEQQAAKAQRGGVGGRHRVGGCHGSCG